MRRIKIVIRLSRYQQEKAWGEMWRREEDTIPGESFEAYRKRKRKELKR